MRTPWEDIIGEWEYLASKAYTSARLLTEHDDIVKVYEVFKEQETQLFDRTGWTYEEFRAETLSRASGELGIATDVQQ